MAVLAAAALLDELMGRNRNIAPNEKGRELNWEDAKVRILTNQYSKVSRFFYYSTANILWLSFVLMICL